MVPLRISRILLILFLISITLTVVDELVLWTGMPAVMRVVATGLASGAIVFAVIFRGGTVIRFAMRHSPSALTGAWTFAVVLARTARCRGNGVRPFKRAYRVMQRVMNQRPVSPATKAALDVAMATAVAQIDRPPRVILYRSDRPSAVTANDWPQCCIFVSTGMVKSLSTESLAAVLSHECGHVWHRHPLRQAIVLGLLAGVKMSIGVPPAAVVAVLIAYLMMLREWEYVADRHACKTVGADRMQVAFEEYRAASGDKDSSSWSELLSGHPSMRNRVAALREFAAAGGELKIPEVLPYLPLDDGRPSADRIRSGRSIELR